MLFTCREKSLSVFYLPRSDSSESTIPQTHLNVATFPTNTPVSHSSSLLPPPPPPPLLSPRYTNPINNGNNGNNTLFSWTWNEKRKKDKDEVRRESWRR
jgi:hypothetical protein